MNSLIFYSVCINHQRTVDWQDYYLKRLKLIMVYDEVYRTKEAKKPYSDTLKLDSSYSATYDVDPFLHAISPSPITDDEKELTIGRRPLISG